MFGFSTFHYTFLFGNFYSTDIILNYLPYDFVCYFFDDIYFIIVSDLSVCLRIMIEYYLNNYENLSCVDLVNDIQNTHENNQDNNVFLKKSVILYF